MSSLEVSIRIHRQSIHEAKGMKSHGILIVMVLFGMIVSGIIQRCAYPPDYILTNGFELSQSNLTNGRRYCHPPNVSSSMYENYYGLRGETSEGESGDNEYDFEGEDNYYDSNEGLYPDYQVELTIAQEEAHWRWQALLWGSFVAPIPATWLSGFFGPGRILGFCVLACGVVGLFVPTEGLLVQAPIVFIQGVFLGCIEPSALLLGYPLIDEKRAMFLSLLAGSNVGFGVGELIPNHLRPFTACILAVTWFATWVLMLDTPLLPQKKTSVPWRKLLGSRVLWMSAAAVFGTELLQGTTLYTLRQYLHIVYYFSNRSLLAFPHFFTFLIAVVSAFVGRLIEKKDLVSKTTSRRIFVYISHFLPSALLFVSGFVGCEQTAPVVLFSLSTALGGAAYAGAFASILDISATFPEATVFLVCTCGSVARLVPVLLTSLLFKGLMPGSWRLVLSLNSLIALVTAMLFMLRGSSRIPSWNYPGVPQLPKLPRRITLENCILRVLAVKESGKFTRGRAFSTSITRSGQSAQMLPLKRASIS